MALSCNDPVSTLSGVGPKRALALSKLGIGTIGDLLWHMPLRYEDRRYVVSIAEIAAGEQSSIAGVVESVSVRRSGGNSKLYIATVEVADSSASASVVLFGGVGSFGRLREGMGMALYGTPEERSVGRKKFLEFASPEYVTYRASDGVPADWCRIVPIYPTTADISRTWLSKLIFAAATSPSLQADDEVSGEVLHKRNLPTLLDALHGIHAPVSFEEIESSRRRLAYGEFFAVQKKIRAAASRNIGLKAYPLSSGSDLSERFVASLPFDLTGAQKNAIDEISRDIDRNVPMRRLLHGDVGSGKTVAALAAVARCVGAKRQAAILVPTTVLSGQFFGECVKYLKPLGIRCAELRGGVSKRDRTALLDGLVRGEIDVLVGTHALMEKDVEFQSLALVIVDEQHRFGVRQREALYSRGGEGLLPHVLTMSATPIPRTLCMAIYGDIGMSAIREKPACRKPAVTRIMSDNHIGELYVFLSDRLGRGDRCFWVCPLIGCEDDDDEKDEKSSVMARAADIEKRAPSLRVERLYGSMSGDEKISAVARFASGESNMLVSTTVVEVGVDVPDAGIMVVEGASRFGLSQLHQLRGRVGRGSRAGVCILLDTAANLSANKRLSIMLETDDGFRIAEEDLKMRGAGELAGLRQHGFSAFKAAELPQDADLLTFAMEDAKEPIGATSY